MIVGIVLYCVVFFLLFFLDNKFFLFFVFFIYAKITPYALYTIIFSCCMFNNSLLHAEGKLGGRTEGGVVVNAAHKGSGPLLELHCTHT